MSILYRYIYRNLTLNKSSTLLSILSICVASTLFYFTLILGLNTVSGLQQSLINSYGNYHASFQEITSDFNESLSLHTQIIQKDIVEVEKVRIDDSLIENNESTVELLGLNKSTFNDLGLILSEGRYPTNPYEIVISESFIRDSNFQVNLNSTILLNDKNYQVVGIITSSFFENKSLDYCFLTIPNGIGSNTVFLRYIDVSEAEEVTNQIASSFSGEYSTYHLNLSSLTTRFFNGEIQLSLLFWLSLILITFLSINILLIRNSYKNSYLNREKHLAILKTVGVTTFQCEKMVVIEGVILLLIGLPLGLLFGYLGYHNLNNIINELLLSISIQSFHIGNDFQMLSSVLTIIYITFFALYFIRRATKKIIHQSIFVTLQSSDEIEEQKKPYLNLEKKQPILIRLFIKNIRQNFRNYRHLMIGATLIMILLILWNGLMGYARDSGLLNINDQNYDVEVSFESNHYPTSFMTQLKNVDNASNIVISEKILMTSNDMNSLNHEYKDQSIDEKEFTIEMISYSDEVLQSFMLSNSFTQSFDEINNSNEITGILINHMYHPAYRRFYSIIDHDSIENISYNNQLILSKMSLIKSRSLISGTNYQKNPQILVTRKVLNEIFEKIDEENHKYTIYFQSNDSNSLVRELSSLNDEHIINYSVENIKESLSEGKSMIALIRLFSYGYIIGLIIMSVLSFCCIASTNFEYRRKEFILFHILGLRIKDIMRLVFIEVVFYLTIIMVVSWSVSQLLNFIIYKLFFEQFGIQFFIPMNSIFGSILCLFIIVIGFMLYFGLRMKSRKYSEVLKNDISLM